MALGDLNGSYLQDTYQFVTQVSKSAISPDKWVFADGVGNPVYWVDLTASYAMTAGYVAGVVGSTPGGPLWSVQFNSASLFTGSSNFTYDTINLIYTGNFYVTGAISSSFGSNTVGFFGTASWAVSSSRAVTSSWAISASQAVTASWSISASQAISASNAITASFANDAGNTVSASYADYAAVAGTLTDNIWVRSIGDNSAVINDDIAFISTAEGSSSVAYGESTEASGSFAQSQGKATQALGSYSHAEGIETYAVGQASHTEGYNTRTALEGEPYNLETYILSGSTGAVGDPPTNSDINYYSYNRFLVVTQSSSTLYGLGFLGLDITGSWSGSNNVYNSASLLVFDVFSQSLVAHIDLTSLYDGTQTQYSMPTGSTNNSRPTLWSLFYNPNLDRVYIQFGGYDANLGTARSVAYMFWLSGSYDGTNPPSIYVNNTASLGQRKRDSLLDNSYYSPPPAYQDIRWAFNPINNKAYLTINGGNAFPGLYILDATGDRLEYSGSAGVSSRYYTNGSPTSFFDAGQIFRPAFSGSGAGINSYNSPAIDKNGNVWISNPNNSLGGSTYDVLVITASAHISSSDVDFFKYTLDTNGLGVSSSGFINPFYYPGDGTADSERMLVPVQYTWGSGSQLGPTLYKIVAYGLDGTIRDNKWNKNFTLTGNEFTLTWWPAKKRWLYYDYVGTYPTPKIVTPNGNLVNISYVTASRPPLTHMGKSIFPVPGTSTLVGLQRAVGGSGTHSNTPSSSIVWFEEKITYPGAGIYSHAEGVGTSAAESGSHSEGFYTVASASYSHAEGYNTRTVGIGSHAEGYLTTASADYSHTEGSGSRTTAIASHAEGNSTLASGIFAHAEGMFTTASGLGSHAEGSSSVAFGTGSHAEGLHTIASGSFQTTLGRYNLRNNTSDYFVIGNGTNDANRSDLLNAGPNNVRITGSLIVSNSFQLIGSGSITGSLRVSGSLTTIGSLTISGSFIDTGSFNFIGNGNVTGSLTVSNSFSVIGNTNLNGNTTFTGSLIVSNSLNVIGTSTVTGSSIISGSQTIIGTEQITGSLIVSNSLNVIGTNTTTGSVYITGSSTLIGNSTITGSILMTGSAAISSVNYIDFVTTANPAHTEGRVHWLDDTKTLQVDTEVSNFNIELGHQSIVRVYNPNSYTMTPGMVVFISGSQGNRPSITTASWEGDPSSAGTIGFVATTIGSSGNGYVVTNGLLRNVNTNAFNVGDRLFLSSSGQFTNTPPDAPLHEVRLGNVIVQNATTGVIYVGIMNGYELTELHDVKTTTYTDGDLLVQSSSLWINSKQLTGSYGLTGSLVISGTLAVSSSYGTQTQPAVRVNNDGLLILGEYSTTPTAVAGAMMYSGSDYYLGFP